MKKVAFTLVEILIVIVIAGILATLGFINYSGVQEHAIGKEAQANLKLIAAAEKIYHMETGSYYGPEPSMSVINTVLKLSLPDSSKKWDYAITGATASTFEAKADRSGGAYNDCVYSINDSLEEAGVDSGTCP